MWAIWRTRNDLIFQNKQFHSFIQAIFTGSYWLRLWSLLQSEDTREIIRSASKALEVVALDIFARNGWKSNNRLCFWFSLLCVRSFSCLFFSLNVENYVKTLLCVVVEAGINFLFLKKKLWHCWKVLHHLCGGGTGRSQRLGSVLANVSDRWSTLPIRTHHVLTISLISNLASQRNMNILYLVHCSVKTKFTTSVHLCSKWQQWYSVAASYN
jgi:hypothetical protein